jgi:hypothetical protein
MRNYLLLTQPFLTSATFDHPNPSTTRTYTLKNTLD